ncbi:MAG: alanine racemase [Betaproteobacteria bacterium]|nr:alanine racemase [Betaproteobacteria bacterium]
MRPIKALISGDALRHNLGVVRMCAPRSRVFAVVKANAYGHGLMRATTALESADGLALVEIEAAVGLRKTGYARRIALLEGLFDVSEVALAARHDLTIAVHSREQLAMLDAAPADARFDVMLKINTGMNRLGFAPDEATAVRDSLLKHRAVKQLTLMTHFATADDARGVEWQVKAFDHVGADQALERSAANSAAILRFPATHADWVRPGIMLYGCTPFTDQSAAALGLKPAMTLASEIISVQTLNAGDRIGYAGTFEATGPLLAGVVACGYADGYPRHAPTGTPVLVNRVRTRTLGRVSMDMLMVDLTGIADARVGSSVVLWGEGLSADEVALAAGTVSYELMCAVAPRVPMVDV